MHFHIRSLAVASFLLAAQCAFGLPVGVDYEIVLDAEVTDGILFDTEGHRGILQLDGSPESLPNDAVPLPPLLPGFQLTVTEQLENTPRLEEVSIQIDAPAGERLFANPLNLDIPVFFDIFGLFSNRGSSNPSITLSTMLDGSNDFTAFEALDTTVEGLGTITDPWLIRINLDPEIVVTTKSLRLEVAVVHVPLPLWVIGILGITLAGISSRVGADMRRPPSRKVGLAHATRSQFKESG